MAKASTERLDTDRPVDAIDRAREPRTPRGLATRRRLLEAARSELIERRGVLEVESVVGRVGVSVGLIYRHFGSKAGLVSAVVQAFYKRFEDDVITSNPAPSADWATREHARTLRAVAFHYEDPLAPVVLARLHSQPAVAALEARQLDAHIELAAENVAHGQAVGLVPADVDPRLAAAMVLGGLRRVLVSAMGREPRPSQERVGRELWRFVAAILGLSQADDSSRGDRRGA